MLDILLCLLDMYGDIHGIFVEHCMQYLVEYFVGILLEYSWVLIRMTHKAVT